MIILILVVSTYVSRGSSDIGVKLVSKGDKIGVIQLVGPITSSYKVVKQLKQYEENRSVKAIILRIESPGGGVVASQEIYNKVKDIRDKGKPVVVSMGSVAASGGYYIACGGDTIMANPGTATGSIGVIAEFFTWRELFEKIGIEFDVIKSGRYKDTGSPHRNLTPGDRQYLQGLVDNIHQQFIEVVAKERNLSINKVHRLADGRVFTGMQAREVGLVDLIGDYQDAIKLAAQLGGIEGEPNIVQEKKRRFSFFNLFIRRIRWFFSEPWSGRVMYMSQ